MGRYEHYKSLLISITLRCAGKGEVLIAATLYSQERFDNGQIYSAWHLLPVPEEVDDQDYEFESYDLEVEALAQAGEKT